MISASASPYEILLDYSVRAHARRVNLPVKLEPKAVWNGIAFVLGRNTLLVAMDQVSEVVELPPLTRVPNARSWVMGIANLRGTLLSVVDLKGLLYGAAPAQLSAAQRLIVTNVLGTAVGFLVDQILGVRHVYTDEPDLSARTADQVLSAYVTKSYRVDGVQAGIFDLDKILRSDLILNAAA